jgi:hypothetical protein
MAHFGGKLSLAIAIIGLTAAQPTPASAQLYEANYVFDGLAGSMFIAESFPPDLPLFSGGPLLPDAFSAGWDSDTWGLADLQGGGLTAITTGPSSELIDFSLDAINPSHDELAITYDPSIGVFSWAIFPPGGGPATAGGTDIALVPEPGAASVMIVGLLGLALRRRKVGRAR